MDPWYSMGTGDMLDVAFMGQHVAQMSSPQEMRRCFEMVTQTNADIMGLSDYGLHVGAQASLVVLDAGKARHAPERVQSVLVFDTVRQVASQGVTKGDPDTILSLLSIGFEQTQTPSGHVTLTLAGDGAIRLSVEALDVSLKDVTRPYVAPSKKLPRHDD